MFRKEIDSRNIAIEHLADEDLERHQDLFEMAELQRLEQQIARVEMQKVNILRRERYSQAELMKIAGGIGLDVDALEQQNDFRAKEREREITKLYARMSNRFRQVITQADGALKVKQRKINKLLDPEKRAKMLFDGVRD